MEFGSGVSASDTVTAEDLHEVHAVYKESGSTVETWGSIPESVDKLAQRYTVRTQEGKELKVKFGNVLY